MKILLTERQIYSRVRELADEIQSSLPRQDVFVVGILTGCLMFLADLVRHLDTPMRIGFVVAQSYHGTATTAGNLEYNVKSLPDVAGKHVLLVDDIFDSGQTLARIADEIAACQPASVRSAVLLEKDVQRATDFFPDLVGFRIPAEFVVGYGLDFDGRYRNLPYIAALDAGDEYSLPTAKGDVTP
ncbi:MAG: hypoxanthine phosphoribosyltransferase [Pirellulales bacterium]|nr:hypoxanthine phosphoribosyltransferase [Pirellulales bacterium]